MTDRARPHLTVVRNDYCAQGQAALTEALNQVAHCIPECVAAGLIDLKTGQLLGVKTFKTHPPSVLDRVGDPLRQCRAAGLESMFLRTRPSNDVDERYFREVLVLSDNLIHLFQRCRTRDDVVLMTVCLGSANMGMVLQRLRRQLPTVEATVSN